MSDFAQGGRAEDADERYTPQRVREVYRDTKVPIVFPLKAAYDLERRELPAIQDAEDGGRNAEVDAENAEILKPPALEQPAEEPKAGGEPPVPGPHEDIRFDEVSDSESDEERPAAFNKVRKYKNSTRPRNVDSAIWTRYSESQKKEAIKSYIELKAEYKAAKASARAAAPRAAPLVSRGFKSKDYGQLKEALKKTKTKLKVANAQVLAAAVPGVHNGDVDPAPAMPTLVGRQWSHRDRRQVALLCMCGPNGQPGRSPQ